MEESAVQTHSQAADASIFALLSSDPPRLVVGRDDMVMAVLRNIARLMDAADYGPDYAKLATEARLWWSTVVMPKQETAGKSIFDD